MKINHLATVVSVMQMTMTLTMTPMMKADPPQSLFLFGCRAVVFFSFVDSVNERWRSYRSRPDAATYLQMTFFTLDLEPG
jgi:hypothetical protein